MVGAIASRQWWWSSWSSWPVRTIRIVPQAKAGIVSGSAATTAR